MQRQKTNLQALGHRLGSGGLTRREFITRSVASGMTISAAMALADKAQAQTPSRGGHAVFAIGSGGTGDNLLVTDGGNIHSNFVKEGMIRNKLVDLATDGTLEADLAEEWTVSEDASTWRFRLRPGVEFHNGKTLDAQDVIDSINLHRGEDTTSAGRGLAQGIVDIRVDGDWIVFTLETGNVDFPFYLAQRFFEICPSIGGVPDQSGVGTGPFVLEQFDPGVVAAGRRNENYFHEPYPYFDSVEILSMADSTARINALVTGQVHAIDQVELKTASRIDQMDGVRIVSVAGGASITMPMHANTAPFSDPDVRLAMKYAIDRVELRDTLFSGHATLGNDHPIAPFEQFFNPEIPQREFDPDRARFHLERAGLSSVDVALHTSDVAFSGAVDAAVLYSESASSAGIDVTVQREPADGYWSDVWRVKPFCYALWNHRPTPDLIFSLAYTSDATYGDTYWSNERFDSLVAAARSELDQSLRAEMYHEAQQIVHDDGSTIIPLFQNFVHGVRDEMVFGDVTGSRTFDALRAAERWWFAS
jgi:peptide/nickel transport system substrate-binding protein